MSITAQDVVYAKNERYAKHIDQSSSISNSCLNPLFDSNIIDNANNVGNCGNTVSQQAGGDAGRSSSPITVQSANPKIKINPPPQRPTPEPPAPLEQALVVVFKQVICPSGFEDVCPSPAEFTLVMDGVNPDPSGPFHPLFPVQVFLDPGPYQVFEIEVPDNPPGLELQLPPDFSVGCFGVIQAGETRNCVFTNTYEISPS